jgi:hypothetical protein
MHKPHISFEDTFNLEQIRLYKPFTRAILTGDYPHPLKSRKVVRFPGYHELAYLHFNRFTPDENVIKELGLHADEPFIIVRFVSWTASHDFWHLGISLANKIAAIDIFSTHSRVFISSELPLLPELEKYRFPLPPYRMHHAMAFASLIFGESATMASEGAMLGIPGIYLDNTGRLYTREQEEKYNLVFNYTEKYEDQQKAIEKGIELLHTDGLKKEWKKRRDKMLSEKIDVTSFLVWFIESYPDSHRIMKENPNYQYTFK